MKMKVAEEASIFSLIGYVQPQACEKPWMKDCEFALGTPDNIGTIIDECIASGRFGLDLETSGLDNRVLNGTTVDHIAGVCIAPTKNKTYYILIKAKLERVKLPFSMEYLFFFVSLWDFETDWYREGFFY